MSAEAVLRSLRNLLGIEIEATDRAEVRLYCDPVRVSAGEGNLVALARDQFFGVAVTVDRAGIPVSIVAPANLPAMIEARRGRPLRETVIRFPEAPRESPPPAGEGVPA